MYRGTFKKCHKIILLLKLKLHDKVVNDITSLLFLRFKIFIEKFHVCSFQFFSFFGKPFSFFHVPYICNRKNKDEEIKKKNKKQTDK